MARSNAAPAETVAPDAPDPEVSDITPDEDAELAALEAEIAALDAPALATAADDAEVVESENVVVSPETVAAKSGTTVPVRGDAIVFTSGEARTYAGTLERYSSLTNIGVFTLTELLTPERGPLPRPVTQDAEYDAEGTPGTWKLA